MLLVYQISNQKKNGKHKFCEVFGINKIKDVKKKNLEENIKCLEDLSKGIEDMINGLKKLFEKINDNKENKKKKFKRFLLK